jgi:hypothetical protein
MRFMRAVGNLVVMRMLVGFGSFRVDCVGGCAWEGRECWKEDS